MGPWLLPLLAIAFGLGVVAGERFAPVPGMTWLVLASCGLGLAFRRSPRACALCAVTVAGVAGMDAISVRLAAAEQGRPAGRFDASVEARVCERFGAPPRVGLVLCDARRAAMGRLRLDRPMPERMHLSAFPGTPEQAWLAARLVGETLRARVRVEAPRALRNPGGRDSARTWARRGVGARARLLDARLAVRVDLSPGDPAAGPRRWREGAAAALVATGRGGALLAALGLGDRRGLDESDREAFRRLGIAHLLAVSGLHLGVLAMVGFRLLRWLAARVRFLAERSDLRVSAAAGAVALGLGYAVLVGFGPAVQRAWGFVAVALGFALARRPRAARHALAVAALGIAAWDPSMLFSLGAQLSFVATAAILAGIERDSGAGSGARGLWRRVGAALLSGLRVSSCAIAATAPVLAAHGLPSAPVGLLANAVSVPVTASVLLPASLAAVAMVGAGAPIEWVAPLESVAAAALRAADWLAAGLPPVRSHPPPALLFLAAAGLLALACARARATGARVSLCLAVCGVLALAPREHAGPPPPRVVAFDVGLGDSTLIQGLGAAVLVDAGRAWGDVDQGRSVVVPGLRALGVASLDLVIASHADADHAGGLPAVVAELPVAEIWVPRGTAAEFQALQSVAARRGVRVLERGRGDRSWRRGDVTVRPLWPPAGQRGNGGRNHASLVAAVTVTGERMLVTGDIDAEAEQRLLELEPHALRAGLLKVAHHGSATSSTSAFLEAVGFDLALVSASCGAHQALPSRATIERLERAGGSLWWTGRDGALVVSLPRARVGRGEKPTNPLAGWSWLAGDGCSDGRAVARKDEAMGQLR